MSVPPFPTGRYHYDLDRPPMSLRPGPRTPLEPQPRPSTANRPGQGAEGLGVPLRTNAPGAK